MYMMKEIKKDDRINDISPTVKAVAATNYNGVADVEYQLEVKFNVGEYLHKVKISCYTTTCNLLVQNMGGKHETKDYLDNRHVARFFVDEFIFPVGKEALKNESIDENFLPQLKAEIKRLQELNFLNKKRSLKPIPKSIKCANENCSSPGGNLVTKNITAYAQCEICDGCEHYKCAKVKEARKAKKGLENFQ